MTQRKKAKTQRGHGEGTIGQRPDGQYYAAIPLGSDPLTGKRKRRWVYGKTEKEVIRKMRQVERQIEDGVLVTPDKMTVAAYTQEWLKNNKARWKPRTYEIYTSEIRLYIEPKLGRVQLQKLTPLHVEQMVRELAAEKTPSIANHARTRLSTILTSAVKHGLIARNVAEMTSPVRVEKRDTPLWTPQQIRHFLTVAAGHRMYALFYLAFTTGMRRGELLGLKWSDLQENVITVKRTLVYTKAEGLTFNEPKTQKGWRQIPVNQDTVEVLRARRQAYELEQQSSLDWKGNDLIFGTQSDSAYTPRNIERDWYKLLDKSGLPRITMHDMRHTHATMLVAQGIDVRHLADRLGHARPSFTLDVYAHVYAAQREKAALSLTQLLGETDGENTANSATVSTTTDNS